MHHSLKRIELDVIYRKINSQSVNLEEVTIDASLMGSLNYLNFNLRGAQEKGKLRVVLKLGDFYESLKLIDKSSLRGQLTDGSKLQIALPKGGRVVLADQMANLKNLLVNDWSLVDDIPRLFDLCDSMKSLHLEIGHAVPSSVIRIMANYFKLKHLNGNRQRFLRMFSTCLK